MFDPSTFPQEAQKIVNKSSEAVEATGCFGVFCPLEQLFGLNMPVLILLKSFFLFYFSLLR